MSCQLLNNSAALGFVSLLLLARVGAYAAAEYPRAEMGPKSMGKVHEWKSKTGLAYTYFIPKSYTPKKGANLTFVLHGSNLSRYWGFANHKAGVFRPDDVVVCPDGTTSNGQGGFNSLGKGEDLERFKALHDELKQTLKVRATFLYGHSQGSFFAFHYAGAYPEEVQGVVGHASGVWTWTQQGPGGHHQAILLMHGTQDPVMPYSQSVGGAESFRAAKYPTVRLRSLEGWNHWPAEHNSRTPHTSQQLAWCEGMITKDPERLSVSLNFLCAVRDKEWHDYAGAYALAQRAAKLKRFPSRLRKRASKAIRAIDKLAAAHVAALKKSIRKNSSGNFDGKAWVGHAALFLRTFEGVPRCDAFAEEWSPVIERHKEDAIRHLRKYYKARKKGDEGEAFAEGILAVEKGGLYHECSDRRFLKQLHDWKEEAADLHLPAEALTRFEEIIPAYEKALEAGRQAFESIQHKVMKF